MIEEDDGRPKMTPIVATEKSRSAPATATGLSAAGYSPIGVGAAGYSHACIPECGRPVAAGADRGA